MKTQKPSFVKLATEKEALLVAIKELQDILDKGNLAPAGRHKAITQINDLREEVDEIEQLIKALYPQMVKS